MKPALSHISRSVSPKRVRRGARATGDSLDGPDALEGAPTLTPTAGSGSISRRTTRRDRRRAAVAAAELPHLENEEDFQATWGMTREREDVLLAEFKRQVEAAWGAPLKPFMDSAYLRRFLRARQHDIPRAKDMLLAHLAWRKNNGIDTILQDFHFQERDAFLSLYPQGYHKTDKLGRPVYIQHLGSINVKALAEVTSEERMLRFHIQEYERCLKYIFPACSKAAGRQIDKTFAIMDVKGVGLKHLTGDVRRILNSITSTDQNNYPETLGKTLVINAPTLFKMVWAVVKPMLDVRTQAKIEIASTDYMPKLIKWVDIENIPEYLGGHSKGSLLDDMGPWTDPALIAEVDEDIARRERAALGLTSGDEGEGSVPPSPTVQPRPSAMGPDAAAAGSAAWPAGNGSATPPPVGDTSGGMRDAAAFLSSDSDMEEWTDAMSRRGSLYANSVSSAYLSADEEGDYYSPTVAAADAGGLSFRSDRPLLEDSSPYAPSPPSPPRLPSLEDKQQAAAAAEEGKARLPGVGPGVAQQIPIMARVRALEEHIPQVERPLRRYLPPGTAAATRAVGQGTLLGRVEALESAMDALLRAQDSALVQQQQHLQQQQGSTASERSGCSGCCCIM